MTTDIVRAPAEAFRRSSRGLRQLVPWLLALAVATCTQDNVGPSRGGVGYFSFRPVYPLASGVSLSQFGIVADSVHVVLTRPVNELVLDTTVAFPADSTELRLALPVELASSPEVLDAVIEISAGGVVIFRDSVQVTVKDGAPGAEPPPVVSFNYVGPGSNIASLTVAPGDTTLTLGDTLFFTASAIDSSDAPVANFYVGWKTSDTLIARINAAGRLIAPLLRGNVRVIGLTPTGIADTTVVTFAPVPVIITADSGNLQSAIVGDSLGTLLVARVKGADSLGISGIPVRFAAVTAGGSVRDTITLFTDANGRVRTRAFLGTLAGGYTYTATALGTGLPARTFTATAGTAAATVIAVQSGAAQVDTIGKNLAPFVVRVADAFNNPVAGAMVHFTRSGPRCSLISADSVLTNASGLASVTCQLGNLPGLDSVRATLGGTSAFVDFIFTTVPGAAANLVIGAGDLQTRAVSLAFDTLSAQVTDVGGNPLAGVPVSWQVGTGAATLLAPSSLTAADGYARMVATAGTLAGPVTVLATLAGTPDTVTFALTVAPGAPTVIAIAGGDAQVDTITRTLALPLSVHVTDAFTNDVPGAKVYWTRPVGTGTLALDSSVTNASGLAQVGYTLGSLVGTDSIRATIAGTSAFVTFSATAITAAPAQILADSGDLQSVTPLLGYTDSLVVRVLDAGSNPVQSATVNWQVALGSATLSAPTSLTGTDGRARIGVTSGAAAGPVTIRATVGALADTAVFSLSVTPGAPASMVIASGNNQTANASALLALPLVVSVRDAQNNPVPGTTVAFTVTAGGGTIDSATATTNVAGLANSGGWTLGSIAGGNQVRATSAAVPADTLLFDATATPAGTSKIWTGLSTGSWADPNSWSPVGVPGITDNVFLPASAPNPLNATSTTISGLTIENGQTLINNALLTVSADADIGGTISGSGALTLSGSGGTFGGNIQSPTVNVTGNHSMSRNTTITGALNVTSGSFSANGFALTVGGNMTVSGTGLLTMGGGTDSIDVGGNFTISSATSGTGAMSSGVLVLRGNFTQTAGATTNFAPSGTHTTRFLGAGVQTVNFANPGSALSRFQSVEFGSAAGTTLNSTFTAMGIVTANAGTVTGIGRTANIGGGLITDYATWQVSTTLWGQDPSVYPDSLARNVTAFNAWTLTKPFKTDSNLVINGTGVLTLNGQTLRVGGTLTQGGRLVMQNTGDTLDVGKTFTVNSGTTGAGDLTGGVLRLHGGFAQSGASNNYQPSGSHVTRFEGLTGQSASFSAPGVTASRFQNVEFADSVNFGSSAIYVAGDVSFLTGGRALGTSTGTLAGDLSDPLNLGWRFTNTTLEGTVGLVPDSLVTNLQLNGSWTLTKRVRVTAFFTLASGATLDLNGDTLVTGFMIQGGTLISHAPSGLLDVNGSLTVNSGVSGAGALTDGRLVVHQGFTQNAGAFDNFAPSSGHVTEFVGSGGHPLSLTSFSAANSHFQHLVVRDSLNVSGNVAVLGDVTLAPTGRLVGPAIGILLGDLVDSSLAGWRMTTTQLNGKFQSIPSALVSNVTLTDSLALAQTTSVTGNFTLQGAGYIAFGGHGLGVSGNFTQNSRLVMSATQDSLDVGGSFLVSSGSDGTGDLTAGVLVLRGGFTQTSGSFTNFMADAPHRTVFTGAAARTIDLTTPNQVHFGDLVMNASGLITFNTDVHANGSFTVAGGPVAITAAAQRLLRVQDLAVDGLSLDRVRLEMHGTTNAAQVDNVTFTNIAPTLDQLSMELPGLTGDTLKFNNVSFSGTPSTGHYVFVADSVANDAPAVIGFYNSSPLNGALYTATEGTVGDVATILWTHLDWITQPTDAIQLVALAPAPQVGVFDPSNAPVTGYSGTVTLGLFTNPVGAVLGNNSVAAVGGVATFDSLTVSLAGVGFQLQATTSDLGASPPSNAFLIAVPIPAGITTSFNNGGGDNDWFNAANWTFGVPDSLDNVFILPGQTAAVNAPAQVNRLQVGTGGGVLLNAPLTADSSVDAGNTITGGGQLVARGTGFLSGVAGGLVVNGNYLVPVGDTLVADYIVISGATAVLDPGSARIVAIDSLRTEAGGVLNMNDVSAVVTVQGRARFTGGAPALLAGTLEIGGDFSQEENVGAFATAPGFVTLFNGGGIQNATFFSPDTLSDHFGSLGLTGGGTLHLASAFVPVTGNIDIQGGHVVADTQAMVLGTIYGATGAFMEGNTVLIRGDFSFGGVYNVNNTIFIGTNQTIDQAITPFDTVYVQGTATLGGNVAATTLFATGGGQFALGGHRLDLTGDFGTGSGGTIVMADPGDTVMVGGTFYAMGGSTNGLLTAGLLQIAGSFYQGSTPADTIPVEVQGPPPAFDAFRATGTHVTRFVGAPGTQRIIFFGSPVLPADPFSTNNSRFGVLDLIDGIDSLASTMPVDGDLFVDSAHVVNAAFLSGGPAVAGNILVGANVPEFTVSNVSLGGALDVQAAPATYQVGTTLFFGNGQTVPVLPYQDIEVAMGQATLAGDLSVQNVRAGVATEGPGFPGDLRLGGHALTVAGNFTTVGQGSFTMDALGDSLDITGNADLGGGVTTALTAGTLVARGDLYLSDSTLVASGTHRTVFAAPLSQQLWITTGPAPTTQFNKVNVLAGTTVNFNIFSSGPMQVLDSFAIAGSFLQANPGKTVIALGDVYIGTAVNFVLGTLELYKTLDVDLSTYSVGLTRYAGTGQFISPTATYTDLEVTGSAELNTNVTVGQDFIVSGNGTFDLRGHALDVGRDFHTTDNGLVTMQDPADSLRVAYTAFFDGGDTDGLLTAGTLQANYFVQGATTTTRAFRSSGAHRVELMMQDPADQGTTINLASGGPADSRFNELILSPGIGAQVNLTGRLEVQDSLVILPGATGGIFGQGLGATIYAGGAFVVQSGFLVMSFDTLDLGGTVSVPTSILTTPVTRFSGVAQLIPDTQSYQRLEITGTASPEGTGTITTNEIAVYGNGQFTLGANQRATTSADFNTFGNGTLAMSGAGADLFIGGNATFAGGSSGPLLGGGNIRVAGNFTTVGGSSSDPFNSFNTGVTFQGSGVPQVVTIDPATNVNFRSVGIINPNGIQISGLMLVTDSVGTSGPIVGDSLFAFGSLFLNTGITMQLRVFKTSGIFVGLPSLYDVDRTHIMNGNSLPNIAFDTLVINADGVSAFYPINANHLYVAGPGSAFSTGAPASLDLSTISSVVTHTIQVDAHVEGTGAWLEIGEDTLNVGGDFYTSLGGTLRMSGSGALNVTGSTLFGGGSQEGLLTGGTLQVGSGITQQAFSSPSSFRMDGTALDLPLGPAHVLNFETSDSSYLPDLNLPGSGTLNLVIVNKTRVAGGIGTYGLTISGDTLVTTGQLAAGPAGLSVTLDRYEGPVINQFQNVPTWTVATTQFTGAGGLPFSSDFAFDTLIVSDSVIGQLSQILTANHVEVTGPGNPRHIGAEPGVLVLSGGDGNTDLIVNGDVLVRGTGAAIVNYEGNLSASGNFTVDQDGYLYSGGGFGGGSWTVNGNVVIDGASTVDSLVRGSMSIGGNFTQGNSTSNFSFAADSGFTTGFVGGGTHVVSFASPGSAALGSHFGSLAFDPVAGLVMQTDTDLWVEGLLTTTSYANPVLQNTAAVMRTINVQDVAIQGITFDHLQLRLAKSSAPAVGAGGMDIVNFSNFLTTEDQFLVDLPGLAAGAFSWSNFTFTQLAVAGGDSGHYLVASDTDGLSPLLQIFIGSNQTTSGELGYYLGLNGAIVTPFAP